LNTILIVDDDDQLRKSFQKLLTEEGYRVESAASGESAVEIVKRSLPDLAILDMRLPGIGGLETFARIHRIEPRLPVIIMTAFGTTETAIEATKQGAFDYVLKPFEVPDMLAVIRQALDAGRFMRTPVAVNGQPVADRSEAIVGRSKPMQEVYKIIGRVAASDATVLIRGASGTGKELVARAIYQHSLRDDRPFQVINCVAIPETLLESELFGYEKGAFTGAAHRRIGKVEQAHGGTVFLDEIGDMPVAIQGKILRLLQERSIERLGGRETIPVDVRVIAATNRDLEKAIEQGRFREDLYYRLKVVTISLPPLRERLGDIPLLADYFLQRFGVELDMKNPGITAGAIRQLEIYHWPGNIRELGNTIQKMLIFNRGAPIDETEVRQAISEKQAAAAAAVESSRAGIRRWARDCLRRSDESHLFDACMDRVASILIGEALNLTGGNRSQAARLLGLSRPTLHSKIEKYHLQIETSVSEKSKEDESEDRPPSPT
jgi:nitrogen regulation protein NR(I)